MSITPDQRAMTCFECARPAEHNHHVVPRSVGGKRTIPLCGKCHGKVHSRDMTSTSHLTKQAMQHMKAQGQYTGGKVPYGFQLGDGGRLIIQPLEQAVMYAAKTLRSEGMTIRKIAAVLAARGHKSRAGKPFDSSSIHRWLT